MKFDMTCKVYGIVFTKLLKEFYPKYFKELNLKPIIKEIKKEYKAIIKITPGLKRNNKMASNLKGAAYFFAMAKKTPYMTPDIMNNLVDDFMYSSFMKKIYKKNREKGLLFSDKYQNKMFKDSIRSQYSNDEMDWCYTFVKGKDEYSYTMTRCGVCKLARQENMMEYLPCMCYMDYSKYKVQGAILQRTMTLANGDGVCDFHLIKDK